MLDPTENTKLMNPIYWNTHLSTDEEVDAWPNKFSIITAYATTGVDWSDQQNQSTDAALKEKLKDSFGWVKRITGYSPSSGHC
jgi:hypothetical protein